MAVYTRTIKDTPDRGTITLKQARQAARKARSMASRKSTRLVSARKSTATKASSRKAPTRKR